ncbi:MAG: transcriptional regulator [Magnetococcales bacterium]|nr:transcriptional regulator [Magnetococcales bacterium]
MDIKPIKTEQDYELTLKRVSYLMDAESDTSDGDLLDVLVTLVESYENKHFPIDNPTSIEAIKFRMDQMGLTRKDLEPMLGPKSKVSEILSGNRPLSKKMMINLHKELHIPAEVLLGT